MEALADHLAVRATITAPTSGFGLTRPRPPSASSRARRSWARSASVATEVIIALIDWSVNRLTQSQRLGRLAGTFPPMAAEAEARSFGRSAGTLSAGVGLAGVLTYVFFALASHNLDATAYGEIVVLWSATFVTISVLHRPVEQFISRTVAERRARGEPIGPALARSRRRIQLRRRGRLRDRRPRPARAARGRPVLRVSATLYWVYVGAVLAFAASFFARGYLAGEGRFGLLAGLLVCESFSRMRVLARGRGRDRRRARRGRARGRRRAAVLAHRRPARLRPPRVRAARVGRRRAGGAAARLGARARRRRFAAAVLLVMLSEQTFLNAGPLLRPRRSSGAAAAGLHLQRADARPRPAARLPGDRDQPPPPPDPAALRRRRRRGGRAFELSVSGHAAGDRRVHGAGRRRRSRSPGPALMQAAFSDRFDYDRAGLLIVTAAMGLYLAATTLNQAALARGRRAPAAALLGGLRDRLSRSGA